MDLHDLESESQIEELGVKQLKIVLTRNCIDFKGCVEKRELTERVKRLWIARQKEKGNDGTLLMGQSDMGNRGCLCGSCLVYCNCVFDNVLQWLQDTYLADMLKGYCILICIKTLCLK